MINLRDLARAAREQGWKVGHTAKGHLRFVPPDPTAAIVVTSGTPGDKRAWKNFLSRLRKQGLRMNPLVRDNPQHWKGKHPDLFDPGESAFSLSPEEERDPERLETIEDLAQELLRELEKTTRHEDEFYSPGGGGLEGEADFYFENWFESWLPDNQGAVLDSLSEDSVHIRELVEELLEMGFDDAEIAEGVANVAFFYPQLEEHSYYRSGGSVYQLNEDSREWEWRTDDFEGTEVEELVEKLGRIATEEELEEIEEMLRRKGDFGLSEIDWDSGLVAISGYTQFTVFVYPHENEIINYLEELKADEEEDPSRMPRAGVEKALVWVSPDSEFMMWKLESRPAFKEEGIKLGHCVGTLGSYWEDFQAGKLAIYNLRTKDGKSKFTLEAELDEDGDVVDFDQIKGKANRIPGFGARGEGKFKPTEVKLLEEYVRSVGVDPWSVSDLQPGLAKLYGKEPSRENPRRKSDHHCAWCARRSR